VLSRSNPSLLHATSRDWQPCVYIMASRKYGTLDIGVTSNIAMRAWQHREGILPGFTKKYGIKVLVYYEYHATMEEAITREKQIKEWRRAWKIELIESVNRNWRDLYPDLAL
jgi:putative endonuclease